MSTDKANAGSYLVVDKAICLCLLGTSPAKLIVSKNKKVYANKKLVATEEETTFEPPMFGTCAKYPYSCAFAPKGKWKAKPGKSLYDAGKLKILTDAAEIECAQGGKISVLVHGQVEGVPKQVLDDFDTAILASTNNCLISESEVNHIKNSEAKELVVGSTKANGLEPNNPLYIRQNRKIVFAAYSGSKELKDNVSWAFFQKDNKGRVTGLKLFQGVGAPHNMTTKKPGTYYMEGFGSKKSTEAYVKALKDGNITVKPDSKCTHEIKIVEHNTISDIVPLNNAKSGTTKSKEKVLYIRQGTDAILQVLTICDQEEGETLNISVLSNNMLVLDEKICSVKGCNITLNLPNGNTQYTVIAELACADPDNKLADEKISEKLVSVYAVQNEVVGINCKLLSSEYNLYVKEYQKGGNAMRVRPRSKVLFTASFHFEKGVQNFELEKVRWKIGRDAVLNTDGSAHTGESLETTFKTTGIFKIEASVKDAWGPITAAKSSNVHTLEVVNNKVIGVYPEQRGLYYTEKKYTFKLNLLFGPDYDKNLDGSVTWVVKTMETYPTTSHQPHNICTLHNKVSDNELRIEEGDLEIPLSFRAGKYKVGAVLKKFIEESAIEQHTVYTELEVHDGTVEYWEFTDSQKRRINLIGLKQQFCIQLKVPAWAEQKVSVHLWLHDLAKYFGYNSFKQLKIDELKEPLQAGSTGEVLVTIPSTSKLWSEYLKSGSDWWGTYADLYFSVSSPPFPCEGVMENDPKERAGQYFLKEEKRTGRYLQVTHKPNCRAFFADADGEKLFDVIRYSEPAKAVIYLQNQPDDQKYKVELYENHEGGDKLLASKPNLVPESKAEGLLTIDIPTDSPDMGIMKTGHAGKPAAVPRLFYFMLYKMGESKPLIAYPCTEQNKQNDAFITHPDELTEGQNKVVLHKNYLKQLKVAEESKLSKSTKANFPVILGEEFEAKKKVCVCKEYTLIWGNKVNCDFRKKVVEIAQVLWPTDHLDMANCLMAVFAWESGGTFKSGVPNMADSGGTGLIQFMPSTAKQLLGKDITIEYTTEFFGKRLKRVKEFAEMTEIKQLDYVKKYFLPLKDKKVEFVDFYLQVLFPASSLKEDHIVFADTLSKITTRLSESNGLRNLRVLAYTKNSGFDKDKDGIIWKSDINVSIQKYLTEGRSNLARKFECIDSKKNTSNCTSVIRIVRKWEYLANTHGSSSTVGTFTIDDNDLTGYILEPYGESTTQEKQDKRIPAGSYHLEWYTSNKFCKSKYAPNRPVLDNGFPVLYNEDVAKNRAILIHTGNTGSDSLGCLLPGSGITVQTLSEKKYVTGVTSSGDKFYQLINYLEEKGIDNVEIIITEEYEDYE